MCHDKFGLRNSELFDPFDLFDVRDFGKVSRPSDLSRINSASSPASLSLYRLICASISFILTRPSFFKYKCTRGYGQLAHCSTGSACVSLYPLPCALQCLCEFSGLTPLGSAKCMRMCRRISVSASNWGVWGVCELIRGVRLLTEISVRNYKHGDFREK